jgi:hypothetical protein
VSRKKSTTSCGAGGGDPIGRGYLLGDPWTCIGRGLGSPGVGGLLLAGLHRGAAFRGAIPCPSACLRCGTCGARVGPPVDRKSPLYWASTRLVRGTRARRIHHRTSRNRCRFGTGCRGAPAALANAADGDQSRCASEGRLRCPSISPPTSTDCEKRGASRA